MHAQLALFFPLYLKGSSAPFLTIRSNTIIYSLTSETHPDGAKVVSQLVIKTALNS